jgi:hypothetical protein
MQASEATEIVGILAFAYRDVKVSEATCQVYQAFLTDLDYELTKLAVQQLINTNVYFPRIAEIRATVADLRHGPKRRGVEAFEDVVLAIRRLGAYGVPTFKDPIVTECVQQMTWRALCLGDNEAADRARFIELYDVLATRARTEVVTGRALPAAPRGLGLPSRVGFVPLALPPKDK